MKDSIGAASDARSEGVVQILCPKVDGDTAIWALEHNSSPRPPSPVTHCCERDGLSRCWRSDC